MIEQEIDVMVHKLPFYLKKEVLNYVEFLSNKCPKEAMSKVKFKFDWEGGLADLKNKISSVELQHKAVEWR